MYGKAPQHFLTEDQEARRRTVARLARERIGPRAAEVDEKAEYPHDVFELLREHGIVGMTMPEAYGGGGLGLLDLCVVTEELAKACTAAALMPVLTNIVGTMLLLGGSEAQKARYLPPLAAGHIRFSNAVTEPGAGSDAAAIATRAAYRDGAYVLDGTKVFITGVTVSDFFVVFARVEPGQERTGISAFIVPRDAPGLAVGRLERKMGIRGMPSGELLLQDCRVPAEARLGREGEGLKLALGSMTRNRPAIGARGVGLAQGALDVALAHCRVRQTFGKRLIEHQGLQFKLADMAMEIEAARQLVHAGARLLDRGTEPRTIEAVLAMGKCFATDVAMRVATEAVQLLGAYGYSSEFPVERLMRDAKHLQIVDGTNEIQRVIIARALDTA